MTKQPNKSRRRFFLTLIGGGLLGLWFIQIITFLANPTQPQMIQKIIDIPQGADFRTVAQLLEGEGLIKGSTYFIILGKLTGVERMIKPGEYAIHSHMYPLQILELLRKGDIFQYTVVIPEGYTIKQIAELLEDRKLVDSKTFIGLAHDAEFIRSQEIQSSSLEGYLFPSTYRIAKKTAPEEIIRMMVRAFHQAYSKEIQDGAQKLQLTQHQVVTLASLIEKETSSNLERPLVSAVFHNRLRRHIPLQSDPTVIYALPDFDGNLKRVDLTIESPYNTYRWPGLPPGPIANPGKASLAAAVSPAPVDYLFFVSRNDGTHYFSSNIQDHNRAVAKYQQEHRALR